MGEIESACSSRRGYGRYDPWVYTDLGREPPAGGMPGMGGMGGMGGGLPM